MSKIKKDEPRNMTNHDIVHHVLTGRLAPLTQAGETFLEREGNRAEVIGLARAAGLVILSFSLKASAATAPRAATLENAA